MQIYSFLRRYDSVPCFFKRRLWYFEVLGLHMDPATLVKISGQTPDPAARAATEQSHKNFIGDILNNFQLMARFSRFMRQANDFVFKAEEAGYLLEGQQKLGGR